MDWELDGMSMGASGMDGYWDQKDKESAIPPEVARHRRKRRKRARQRRNRSKGRKRVASMADLDGFVRVAGTNTLIRKSEQDLWELKEDDDGEMVVEPLYDDDGEPLRV